MIKLQSCVILIVGLLPACEHMIGNEWHPQKVYAVIAAVALVLLGLAYLVIAHALVQRKIEREIATEIESFGGRLESVRVPRVLDTGPFPKADIEGGPVVRGVVERCYYREVTWRDAEDRQRVSWAEVTVWLLFAHVRGVKWAHGTTGGTEH